MPIVHHPLRRLAVGLGAIILVVAVGYVVGTRRPATEHAPGESVPMSRAPPIVSGAALDEALSLVAAGSEAVPRDRWDPAYVAELLGPDPQMHLRWVRERSVWIPYRGALRGAAGVLMDGQGNSLDRSLLLAALLSSAGHTVRLAHGELSAEEASGLLPVLVARRRVVADGPRHAAAPDAWRGELSPMIQAYALDAASLSTIVGERMGEVTSMLRTLEARTEQQAARLSDTLGAISSSADGPDRTRRALADLRDHWWVQRQTQEGWVDLDLLGDSFGRARTSAAETVAPEALGGEQYHRVLIRLVTERLAAGGLTETQAFEREFRPIDVLGKSIGLQILPEGWRPGLFDHSPDPAGALRALALEQEAWHATLSVGKETVAQSVLARTGKASAPPGGGPFGGLGSGIASALKPGDGSAELSAAWIEYEIQRPGAAPSVVRRQLFDLVGPAARAANRTVTLDVDDARRLERSLALFRTTDILIQAGGIAPEYLTHLTAAAVVANADLLRRPPPLDDSNASSLLDELGERAVPLPSPLYALAMVRISAEPGQNAYLDQPNVLSQHDYLATGEHGILRRKAVDVVANDVGVALDAQRAVDTRRRQGVRDTNAEALVFGASTPTTSVAEAYATPGRWVAITSADDSFLEAIPPDIRERMRDDLTAGFAIVAPAGAVGGWWRTDPHTGRTLGVSSVGWGQSMVEKAAIIMGAVAVGWTFEYLLCSGALPDVGRRQTVAGVRSPLDWLVRPAHAETVRGACLWEAWKAGLLAGAWQSVSVVWPLMLRMFPSLKFFDRPLFATGGEGPGDLPPIFGNPGNAPPAPERCPPGSAAPGTEGAPSPGTAEGTPPPEGAVPEEPIGPQEPEPVGNAGEAPAEAPAPPTDGGEFFDERWGEMPPRDPEEMAETVRTSSADAAEAAPKIGPARSRLQRAQAAVEEAKQELAAATAAAKAERNSVEAGKRAIEAGNALENANAEYKSAYDDLNRLQRVQPYADKQRQLQPLNDELYQAREEMRLARARFARNLQEGRADFESDEYRALQQVTARYEKALKAWAAANRLGAPSPGAPEPGGGETVAMPDRPLPGPGRTQRLETPAGSTPSNAQVPPPADPGAAEALGPTYPACQQGPSPPPGSPPPGRPAASSGGASAKKAPKGTGAFQGDPANRDWLRENWNPDPWDAHPVAGAMGNPKIYDSADQAALARYSQARNQGMDDQAARQESWEEWWSSVQNARRALGITRNPANPYHEWVGPVPQDQVVVGSGAMSSGK